MKFDKKLYLVTGGASGIGLATAVFLAESGARVVVSDRNIPSSTLPRGISFLRCDVKEPNDVDQMISQLIEEHGVPDGVVTSAGVDRHHNFLELEDTEFAEILQINVLGSFRIVQRLARIWAKAPRSHADAYSVVLLSSVNSVIATPSHTAYATSKGAVAQMVRVMAVELAPFGIRVNAMAPGTVRTPLLDALEKEKPKALEAVLRRTPMKRVGEPEEIAAGIAFLLSNLASYITGQSLFADGGRTVQNLTLD
ncbi:SDR family NAD(P)-dependent oxidoreductase [Brucella pseudogrignonensis]|uniref:KR domain protein n=1 Tax=Brucella pseudogrignonensis TaxID=419475 RepID=A0A256GV41_9HYPH|nr:SDR family oxidoreductase [Brucella pseudogrignonensis]OYR30982.1 KR domain protein [Brucella pseudogrignonensis]